jgi:hypothetical protein
MGSWHQDGLADWLSVVNWLEIFTNIDTYLLCLGWEVRWRALRELPLLIPLANIARTGRPEGKEYTYLLMASEGQDM